MQLALNQHMLLCLITTVKEHPRASRASKIICDSYSLQTERPSAAACCPSDARRHQHTRLLGSSTAVSISSLPAVVSLTSGWTTGQTSLHPAASVSCITRTQYGADVEERKGVSSCSHTHSTAIEVFVLDGNILQQPGSIFGGSLSLDDCRGFLCWRLWCRCHLPLSGRVTISVPLLH